MPTPYEVKCDGCGDELDVTDREMDHAGDITIKVEVCKKCIDIACDETREEVEAEYESADA